MNEHRFTVKFGEDTVVGVLHPCEKKTRTCIVISHGFAGSKDSPKWLYLARNFASSGYHTIRFDHRGIGESSGDFADTTLSRRIEDVQMVLDFAKTNFNYHKFFLLGSSFGAVTAIFLADHDDILSTVLVASPHSFDFFRDLVTKIDQTDCEMLYIDDLPIKKLLLYDIEKYNISEQTKKLKNVLVIHGSNDNLTPPSHAELIYNELQEPKRLEIVSGADHPFSDSAHQQIMMCLCLDWFRKF
jgi:alpha/beta superfamily hydrolase